MNEASRLLWRTVSRPVFTRLARFYLRLLFSALGGKGRSGLDQPRLVLVFVIL